MVFSVVFAVVEVFSKYTDTKILSMTTHVLNIINSNIIGMYIFGTRIVVSFYEQLTYFLFLPAIAA